MTTLVAATTCGKCNRRVAIVTTLAPEEGPLVLAQFIQSQGGALAQVNPAGGHLCPFCGAPVDPPPGGTLAELEKIARLGAGGDLPQDGPASP